MNPLTVITGAGPAGSTAALLLARAGWRVRVIEQHRFPRDKVCGECLSPLAIAVLDRLGLLPRIRAFNAATHRRVVLVGTDGGEASISLPRPMLGFSRGALDSLLLEAAIAAGAVVDQPARVEGIHFDSRQLVVRDLTTNSLHTHGYDHLLIAQGKLLPRTPAARHLTGDLGVKAHFANVHDAPDAITLFGLDGHYCGLAPIENDSWNVAMSVPAARVRRFGSDLDALWLDLLRQNSGLADRMRSARRTSDWLVSPLPRFAVSGRWPRHVFPIGNAAAALEPIGGEGMGLAMRSAELAAGHLLAGAAPGRLLDAYRGLWTRRRLVCRGGALILSKPALANLAVRLLQLNHHIGEQFVAWTGKGQTIPRPYESPEPIIRT